MHAPVSPDKGRNGTIWWMLIKIRYYILEDIASDPQGISVIKKRPGETVKLEYLYDRFDIEPIVM